MRPAAIAITFWSVLAPAAATAATAPATASAHDDPSPTVVDFARDVRPILRARCVACHGPQKQKGELRLDARAAAMAGGESHGPAVRPGAAGDSPLVRFVSAGADDDARMPPTGDRLSPAQVAVLRAWVDGGAVWPDGADDALAPAGPPAKDKADHWAFKPVARPDVPAVARADAAWPR
ncbi:MAG: hypothetical protein JWO31_3465, partial [Phycisphaerales bacterium]|nr:hypothetical protein [Phycisphaerales bacterium]